MGKKVFLIRNVARENFGGGESYQLNLAEELKRADYKPVIVTNSEELKKRAKVGGYEILVPPYIKRQNWSGARNLLLPIYFVKLKRLQKWYEQMFKKYHPEVVNIESRDDFIAATRAAKKCGVKVLWTDHADFRNWVLVNINVWYKNLIGKKILKYAKQADAIIMISDYEKKYFDRVASLDNVVVVKNGVVDKLAEYKKIIPRKNSLVFVGRVVDYKGIGELLGAFSLVREKYKDAVLKIYGAGELEKYCEMAGKGVKFYGETREPLKVLAENEVFVLPSHREGLSLSLLDATMMKKTIIASDAGGNSEVVEDGKTGILVPARNVEKLAEAMEKVLADNIIAKKLASGARKKYEEEFDFDKIFAEKMLPLYNNKKECK